MGEIYVLKRKPDEDVHELVKKSVENLTGRSITGFVLTVTETGSVVHSYIGGSSSVSDLYLALELVQKKLLEEGYAERKDKPPGVC